MNVVTYEVGPVGKKIFRSVSVARTYLFPSLKLTSKVMAVRTRISQ